MPPSESDTPRHRRTYRACLECRNAKLRCDLGSVDAPSDPPCRRCRRTGRRCEFAESYQRQSGRKAAGAESTPSAASVKESTTKERQPRPAPAPAMSVPSTSFPLPRDNFTEPPRFDFVYGRNLETPADALRLLCSVADDDRGARQLDKTPDMPAGGDAWIRWAPVREGILTSTEATTLIHLYARNINPCHPLVASQLLAPENLSLLLEEPLLVGAMVCVAVRYANLGQSFDPLEPSRSRLVQSRLTDWIIKRVSFVTMGSSALRTIGTVEALLILSEWPPRAMLLEDSAFFDPGEQRRSSSSACKHQDETAWNLVGLAVRVAQGIGLHDESTYPSQDLSNWAARRRLYTWINCMSADRYVSGRLGRTSLTPTTMSTGWWEKYFFMSIEASEDQSFPLPRSLRSWRQSRVVAEHAHIIGICQEMLYPSPAVTADLIKTGRFQSILNRLKPELDHLWSWLAGDLHQRDGEAEQGETTDPALQELMWRIDHDYVRLYANAIAMRAAVMRLLGHRGTRESESRRRARGERYMADMLMIAVEGVQVLEAVESAIALLRHAIECHRVNVLRFCPGRTFQRIMFASVFLMKAMSVGAVSEKEPEILDLQRSMIDVIRDAAVDDEHIAAEIATLLGRVFPAFPTAPPAILEALPDVDTAPPQQLLPDPTLISGLADLGEHADVFANWTFDPVILLSEMDDFVQAIDTNQT